MSAFCRAELKHIVLYLTLLLDQNISASKLNASVYSISWAHEISGYSDHCKSNFVIQTKLGALRLIAKLKTAKEPIAPDYLKKLVDLYGSDNMLLCVVGLCWFLTV